jgi:hypothetical protein
MRNSLLERNLLYLPHKVYNAKKNKVNKKPIFSIFEVSSLQKDKKNLSELKNKIAFLFSEIPLTG